jgi:hypothetical protein
MKLNLRVKMFPWCRFVWGRTRLPRSIADFRGRDFVLQVRTTRASPVADWIKVSRREPIGTQNTVFVNNFSVHFENVQYNVSYIT